MRLILLVLLVIPLAGVGQTYSDYIRRANNAVDTLASFRDKAEVCAVLVGIYDSAFAIGKPNGDELYNAACANSVVGNKEKAIQFLRRAFAGGYKGFDWMYYDLDLNSLRKEPGYLALEKQYRPDSVIYFFDILRQLNEKEDVEVCNRRLSLLEPLIYRYSMADIMERAGINFKLTSDSLIDFSGKRLTICNATFEDQYNRYNTLERMALADLIIDNCKGSLMLANLKANALRFYEGPRKGNHLEKVMIDNVTVTGWARLDSHGREFICQNSTFNVNIPDFDPYRWGVVMNLQYSECQILNSTFNSVQEKGTLAPFEFFFIDMKKLKIEKSKFNYDTRLNGAIGEVLTVRKNTFGKHLDIVGLELPDFNAYLPFSQAKNTKLVWFDYTGNVPKIRGDSIADLSDEVLYDDLTGLYKRLYDNYRSRADITSANSIYVLMKDLEIAHLKSIEHRTTEETTRLRINQLMGFYTDHATSPGKALIISFYIILVFGVFYCFFPSDWDKTSKSKVIADFKIFIEKNEHGYVKPFFKMMRGLMMSLLNAMALSLNAFITLGFGNIPTTGVARYVCVLQGALGWFLLSLFTVALLNQVLL
ncbi:MAG: hypothetical protein WDO14_12130 [Bacteroidota bacterium]